MLDVPDDRGSCAADVHGVPPMNWTAFRSTPAFGYLIVGLVILYAGAREDAPGDLPSIALALELATTVCTRGVDLVIGPVLPSALTAASLTLPSGVEHRDGDDDLETWAGAAISPGDFLVVPFDGTSSVPRATGSTARCDRCSPSTTTPRPRLPWP